jgi:hypothetical protein
LELKKIDFKKSDDFLKSLIDVLGDNKQLNEVVQVLKACVQEKEDQKFVQYYNLRDQLLVKLIFDLIKFKLIPEDDCTLNVLGKLSVDELNNLMIEYNQALCKVMKYWEWKNVGVLFSYDVEHYNEFCEQYNPEDISDDELDISEEERAKGPANITCLYNYIQDSIKYWGSDKNIKELNDEIKKIKKLPELSNIRFEWHYCTRCDDYDNYDSSGDFEEILNNIYEREDLTGTSIDLLYERAENPKDKNEWEYEYSNVRRVSELPSKENLLLLIWKEVERCQKIK